MVWFWVCLLCVCRCVRRVYVPIIFDIAHLPNTHCMFGRLVLASFLQILNLYLCAIITHNYNVALIMTFLFRLAQVFTVYFRNLEEESVWDTFVIFYKLLDQTMDHRMPQLLDSTILRSFITRCQLHVRKFTIQATCGTHQCRQLAGQRNQAHEEWNLKDTQFSGAIKSGMLSVM